MGKPGEQWELILVQLLENSTKTNTSFSKGIKASPLVSKNKSCPYEFPDDCSF